MVKAMIQVRLQ